MGWSENREMVSLVSVARTGRQCRLILERSRVDHQVLLRDSSFDYQPFRKRAKKLLKQISRKTLNAR